MGSRGIFVRNFDSDDLFESFMLSAITSLLAIRFYLKIAGYPVLGGEGLHIAHIIFGGLLMLIALIIMFNFLSKAAYQLAALIGGLGFGAFIDELGKFITSDNNYFFQPTVAIIYIIFILLYLSAKAITRYKHYSKREYLINALEIVKDSIINNLDKEEKEEAIRYLKKSNTDDPLVKAFIKTVEDMNEVEDPDQSVPVRIKIYLRKIYRQIITKNWFVKVVVIIFIFQTLLSVLHSISFIVPIVLGLPFTLTFAQICEIIFSGISALLVGFGIIRLFYSRYSAFQLFKYSILISIFLTQFFVFYQEQFSALIGLLFNLVILAVLRYMIVREASLQKMIIK